MNFYSRTNEIFDCDSFTYFDEGKCAKVYRSGDTLLKIYYADCNFRFRLHRKMFDAIKKINAPNLVNLYDDLYVYSSAFLKLLYIDAYTMQYVDGERVSLIDCDRKLLIELLKELEETLKILCDNKIILYDVHPKNIVITDDRITIIDPDQFYVRPFCSTEEIYRLNKIELIDCINKVLVKEIMRKDDCAIDFFIRNDDSLTLINNILGSLTENTFYDSFMQKKKQI